MNKILIVEASDSDCRLMSGLLTRAGYEPIVVEDMEATRHEEPKLSPGAVQVTLQFQLTCAAEDSLRVVGKVSDFLSDSNGYLTYFD